MIAREEGGEEGSQGVEIEIDQRTGGDDPPHGGDAQDVPVGGGARGRMGELFAGAAGGFFRPTSAGMSNAAGRAAITNAARQPQACAAGPLMA